ncbi:FIG053235: Diacylglucosamine hydrolase like [hydrothermal vent metagenome]|uniref:FIG053235: Diacylglucosamine hydrolase like n=1 Tax=hydrothermal vent metagenome TaxID=652676 RepID=A0A3B1E1P9_9ZZZZ
MVHICCSVDSHFFLQQLRAEYPNENIIGFFYNPNIHPYSEYKLRLSDVKYSCEKLGIKLIEGNYDLNAWLKATKGLEKEPEKGERCTICFDKRLEVTAQQALKLKIKLFTTTLLMSPLKSQEKLKTIGNILATQHNLNFIFKDYRKGQGAYLQSSIVKSNNIYRQNYCGCLYALKTQRDSQNKICDELMSQIGQQILPNSIESRIDLYKKRDLYESKKQQYKIVKDKFLNYRLLGGRVMIDKNVVPSYFVCYSGLTNNYVKGKILHCTNNIYYLNKNEAKLITLDLFNDLNNTNYQNTTELIYDPLLFKKEVLFRNKILQSIYDLSCLVVLDIIPLETQNIEIFCNSKIYLDVKENVV